MFVHTPVIVSRCNPNNTNTDALHTPNTQLTAFVVVAPKGTPEAWAPCTDAHTQEHTHLTTFTRDGPKMEPR